MLTNTALRLLRRLLGAKTESVRFYEGGMPTTLDGATAVAVTEALISEAAGLGATAPIKAAELAWRNEQQRHPGQTAALSGLTAEGPRGALATALGQALTGLRATTFLSGPDLATVQDLLQTVVGHHVPLVMHVGMRGVGGAGPAPGTGHEALSTAVETGALVLIAANVQEAVDFTLIARRVAEQALVPVIVAQDGEQTAMALQDLVLPSPAFLEKFLGKAGEQITPANTAQQLLFGDARRRVPSWHNQDRPVLLGSPLPANIRGLSQASSSAYLDASTDTLLTQALHEFNTLSGRSHRLLSRHRVEDADIILVVQGAAVEAAEVVCDHVRTQKLRVGVLGMRCLRPFQGVDMAKLLSNCPQVCVLERITAPLTGETALLRGLKASIGHNQDLDKQEHATKFLSVMYGLGGMALRLEDLAALCHVASTVAQPQLYLGLNFTPAESPYPKRQVLLDQLRRNYPNLATQGLGSAPAADLRTAGCMTVSLHRLSGGLGECLVPETAALLHRLFKGGLRCRLGIPSGWGSICIDRVSVANTALKDQGDAPSADLALLTIDPRVPGVWPVDLAKGGALAVLSPLPDDALLMQIPLAVRVVLKQNQITLYRLPATAGSVPDRDELLGSLCGVLLAQGRLDVTRFRLLALQEELLGNVAIGRIERFAAGFDTVRRVEWPSTEADVRYVPPKDYDTAPATLHRPNNSDSAYDSLPRFWDHVGVLYARGDYKEFTPDPYLAIGAIPAGSAVLRDMSSTRTHLPVLDPAQCNGCGACWSVCPEGAWGAALVTTTQILDAGLRATGAAALRPAASKLVAALVKECQATKTTIDIAKVLEPAFVEMLPKLPVAEERKATVAQDMQTLIGRLKPLSLMVTDLLFREPETKTPGKGALLALALNADACKGCALCITSCAPGALHLQRQDASTMERVRIQRQAWNILPNSDVAAVERLHSQQGLAGLGAALLAPGAATAMTGGDGMEPGSGARLAVRLLLALTEAHQTPIQNAWQLEVQEQHKRIMEAIRALLAGALPTDDLEKLNQRLAALGTGPTALATLLGKEEVSATDALDSARLQRLVTIAQRLADLAWRLAEGRTGMGRARTSLVLALRDDPAWGLNYPYNPFNGPVTLDRTGDAPLLAAGIMDGQLRQVTADLALLRQASLELEHPEQAARRAQEHLYLGWSDLSVAEQAKAPPLLVIGDAELLAGRSLSQLQRLLALGLPIKLLVLADLSLGLGVPAGLDIATATWPDLDTELSLMSLVHRRVYIAQSTCSDPDHLLATVKRMLAYSGPAVLHVHAPSPSRHGFPSGRTLARTHDAVASRVFPLFRYDPDRTGVFGMRIDLAGNPETTHRTPAHWALGEERFAALFSPLADNAPEPMALDKFLATDPKLRYKFTPFVERNSETEQPQRLAVAPELVHACEVRLEVWRMLQELAGIVTPFTDRVRQEIEAKMASTHQVELANQANAYEARLHNLHNQMREDTRQALRIRLLELSGYSR